MNTDLLLAFGHIQQAMRHISLAEKEIYLDDLLSENEDALMALQNAIDKIEAALRGVIDDVECDYYGVIKKPIVEMVNNYIGVVK